MRYTIFASLTVVSLALPWLAIPSFAGQTRGPLDRRTMFFPKDRSIGTLALGHLKADGTVRLNLKQIAGAQGTVTVTVPKGYRLVFEPNSRIVEDPKILESTNAPGVDLVKLQISSLDEREEGRCDQAISHLGHFTGVTHLDFDRSDVSDAGLLAIPPLKHLQIVTCYQSLVTGSGIKSLTRFPEIYYLDLSACSIKPEYLRSLQDFPHLTYLLIGATKLVSSDLQFLDNLTSLQFVSLSHNSKVTDDGLKHLVHLKNLHALELNDTKVTANGLKQLIHLPILSLFIPSATPAQLAALHKWFPKAKIEVEGPNTIDSETGALFAPLK